MAELQHETQQVLYRGGANQDPTALSTALVMREIATLKEFTEARLEAIKVVFEERIAAIDRATALFQENLTRVPTDVDKSITHLKELIYGVFEEKMRTAMAKMNEKFSAIDAQFALRDNFDNRAAQAAKDALAVAMSAAEKAVSQQNESFARATQKSEDAFTQQIRALDSTISLITEQQRGSMSRAEVEQLFRGILDKLDGPTGLAMRLENMVARTSGRDDQARRTTDTNHWGIGTVVAGIALLLALISFFMKVQH